MSFASIAGLIRSSAEAALPPNVFLTKNIHFDALERQEPASKDRAIEISAENGEAVQVSMGGHPRFRMEGFLQMRVYEPSGSGEGILLENLSFMADKLRNKRVTAPDITVRFKSPTPVNGIRTGSHWIKILRVPFVVDFYPQVN